MILIDTLKEAHSCGVSRRMQWIATFRCETPIDYVAAAVNQAAPGTVEGAPPRLAHPTEFWYKPTVEYVAGFYSSLRK